MIKQTFLILSFFFTCVAAIAFAAEGEQQTREVVQKTGDVLAVPIGQQSPALMASSRPHSGMSKSAVQAHFGAPLEMHDAVGNPPISSWVYETFTVYFEGDHVIHSVLKNIPANGATVPNVEE